MKKQTDKVANNVSKPQSAASEQNDDAERKTDDEPKADGTKISEAEAIKLRRFLKDGCEFSGLTETAIAILKKESSRQLKVRALSKKISQIFRLSEDYDSDESDIEDDLKWLTDKKSIRKKLAKQTCSNLQIEGKVIKFVK